MLKWMAVCTVLFNIAAAGLFYCELSRSREEYPPWQGKRPPWQAIIYGCIAAAAAVACSLFIACFYTQNSFLFTLKRAAVMALLWPVAYTDWKTYRIPNLFIAAGLAARGMILAAELVWERQTALPVLLTEICAALIIFVAAALCNLLIKNSIGGGDRKLFLVMGLFLGLQGTWGAIFLSLIISFIAAVFLLLTRKKTRKDSIPFGPAVAAGTFLSIFLTGM